MRAITLVPGLAALTLTACGQGAEAPSGDQAQGAAEAGRAAAADLPAGPTPGLWRVTTEMPAAGMRMPSIETCVREAAFQTPQEAAQAAGMDCDRGAFRREGDALVGQTVCTARDGVRTVTDMRVTGDYSRAYRMEVKSTMTPAPSPSMAEVTMVIEAERLGDCPADTPAP